MSTGLTSDFLRVEATFLSPSLLDTTGSVTTGAPQFPLLPPQAPSLQSMIPSPFLSQAPFHPQAGFQSPLHPLFHPFHPSLQSMMPSWFQSTGLPPQYGAAATTGVVVLAGAFVAAFVVALASSCLVYDTKATIIKKIVIILATFLFVVLSF